MVPESDQAGSIRLYKALKFPTYWTYVGDLLNGPYYVDPSIFHYNHKWWLFTESSSSKKHDTLRLFYSDDLKDPWYEHLLSPVVQGNGHIAKPEGRVIVFNK